jgi:hypothetical protein
MFNYKKEETTSYASPKTTKGETKPKYTQPEIPEGLAPYWQFGEDISGLESTICILVKARGPKSNVLPDTYTQWETVSVGIAFKKPEDLDNPELAKIISLGRAIKAYKNSRKPSVIAATWQGVITNTINVNR